ncbi:MAG: DUF5011 domain-containing protein [Gammaproteobacteria bacterium]|nr:DUF5011 domain-containing protein [Gammaproteobacteria bacterium]
MQNRILSNFIVISLILFLISCNSTKDIIAPVITLIGDDPLIVAHGSTFTDPGTTVSDNVDSGLTATSSGTVDTSTIADYILTYTVSDAAGNIADPVSRTVSVVDMTAPEISLLGDNPMTVAFGKTFTDPGATVTDNIDTGLTVIITGTVNTELSGDYLLSYDVSDAAGNTAITATRTVTVSPAIFKISAGYYDTCVYTGDDEKLRCFGYNHGAHGNGHERKIGDNYDEANDRVEVCKTSAEQILTFTLIDNDPNECPSSNEDSKKVEWFEEGNATALGNYAFCLPVYDKILIVSQEEESVACDNGAYAMYLGKDLNDDLILSTSEMGSALIPAMLPNLELLEFDVAYRFGCGIFSDTTTRCWGYNEYGQLGKGASGDALTEAELGDALMPVNFGDDLFATEIHLGDNDSACALLNDGSIKCWGSHDSDTIGIVTDTDIGLTEESMGNNLLPIDFGTNPDTQQPYKATTMTMDYYSACAVLENGGVKCWGSNESGNLGIGEVESSPLDIIGNDEGEMGDNLRFALLGDFNAVQLSTSYTHTCALSDDNRLKCWGYNNVGQLGLNDTQFRGNGHEDSYEYYVYIYGTKLYEITELNAANNGPSLCPDAPDNKGFHLIYGEDDGIPSGTAGNTILDIGEIDESIVECDTDELTAFVKLDLAFDSILKLIYGAFASDYAEMGNALPHVDLGTDEVIKKVETNYYNACVLFETGKVKCWGESYTVGADSTDNIGNSAENTVANAAYVDLGTTDKVVDIALGSYQSCAIFETGKVKCWGYSEYGELGLPQFYEDYVGDGDPEPEMGENLPYVNLR